MGEVVNGKFSINIILANGERMKPASIGGVPIEQLEREGCLDSAFQRANGKFFCEPFQRARRGFTNLTLDQHYIESLSLIGNTVRPERD